jgi:hypothetical protein
VTVPIEYTYTCIACRHKKREQYQVPLNGEAPRPFRPSGWFEVEGRLYCDRHDIKLEITVDGDKEILWSFGLSPVTSRDTAA